MTIDILVWNDISQLPIDSATVMLHFYNMSFSHKWSDQVSILRMCTSSGLLHNVHQLNYLECFEHDKICNKSDHITSNFKNRSGHFKENT